jgi:hypothetical protein
MKVTIRELLTYLSADSQSCGYFTGDTVADVILKGRGRWSRNYSADVPPDVVIDSILDHGLEYPVHVGLAEDIAPDYGIEILDEKGQMAMGNGHHRLRYLIELGFSLDALVETTGNKEESGFRK